MTAAINTSAAPERTSRNRSQRARNSLRSLRPRGGASHGNEFSRLAVALTGAFLRGPGSDACSRRFVRSGPASAEGPVGPRDRAIDFETFGR